MKFSYKLSDAIHILAYIVIYGNGDLSSRAIAASVESNASVIRGLMGDLTKAGLISTVSGSAKPRLARNPGDITVLDIYKAVNMNHNLLHIDPKTNPMCIVGGNIQDTLGNFYTEIEETAYAKMNELSLKDIIDDIQVRQSSKE